ncbi:Smr/MutS family protein [Denitromonas iodatirespirans]|uniref:Smr/MutS family protein n=1 Tax=Denitromonas iodatirespirans TaxID=2795389 RepID=A0A944H7J1_DENI1|nr:Smr/MutS family protein [Denitromonas iodatirespirans]MBT0961239.1 Smr/MutS family protein [Denitromonas iodatirespirans]
MARKRRPAAAPAAAPARLPDARFAALKPLKAARRGQAPQPPAPPLDAAPDEPADEAASDTELFRSAIGTIQPIDDGNRAEIAPPRPAPVPKARPVETHDDAPRRHAPAPGQDEAAWFQHQMQDVIPLPDDDHAWPEDTPPLPAPPAAEPLPPPTSDVMAWLASGTQPLKPANRADVVTPPPVAAPRLREADEQAALRESLEAPLSFEDRLDMGDEAAFLRTGLPRRVLTDLRRGRWVVQGEIDLHGLTRDEARAALAEFLAGALRRGARCVRVVHGKGLRSPGKIGILKQLSKGWLSQREEILAFCQARANEGGSGALRVLLRAPDKARP